VLGQHQMHFALRGPHQSSLLAACTICGALAG
jgi:hypothetical protein